MGAWATIEPMSGPSYGLLGSWLATIVPASMAASPASLRLKLPVRARPLAVGAAVGKVAPGGGSCLQPADQLNVAPATAKTATKPMAQDVHDVESVGFAGARIGSDFRPREVRFGFWGRRFAIA